jgi:selT/selW/selH-like putative selenoprotein
VEVELKANYPGSHIELIKGGGGVFDVTCDGSLMYSKLNIAGQRFPNDGEITRLIQRLKD